MGFVAATATWASAGALAVVEDITGIVTKACADRFDQGFPDFGTHLYSVTRYGIRPMPALLGCALPSAY